VLHNPAEQQQRQQQPQRVQTPAPHVVAPDVEESPSLQEHPNKPLRPAKKWTSKRPWTRQELDKAREEFFHVSMVVNDPAAWVIINEVCKLLWNEEMLAEEKGSRRSSDTTPALVQAQVCQIFIHLKRNALGQYCFMAQSSSICLDLGFFSWSPWLLNINFM
jgi:hypothetical protein